jgi:hypothetical protein
VAVQRKKLWQLASEERVRCQVETKAMEQDSIRQSISQSVGQRSVGSGKLDFVAKGIVFSLDPFSL